MMTVRNTLLGLTAALFSIVSVSCSGQASPPKLSYLPASGHVQIYENEWFSRNNGIPYMHELDELDGGIDGRISTPLTWRTAMAYNQGEYLAITAEKDGLDTPIVIHRGADGQPQILFREKFPQRFRSISFDAGDYGGDSEEEIALVMQYGNKESILIIDPRTMKPVLWYEADDISVSADNGEAIIVGTSYDREKISMQAYRRAGESYVLTDVPQELRLSDKMIENVSVNKDELVSAMLTDPQQAIARTQSILGTGNHMLVSTALQFAAQDVYAVDEEGSKPFWQYMVEYDIAPGEANARVAMDPLVAYGVLNQMGVGGTPLPWAGNEALAVVVAKNLSKKSGSTYLNLRLVRGADGKFALSGDVEPGERLIKVSQTAQVYLPVLAEQAREIQQDMNTAAQQGTENLTEILRSAEERGRQYQEMSRRQAEELKRQTVQQIKETGNELGKQAEETAGNVKDALCDNLPAFVPKPDACK